MILNITFTTIEILPAGKLTASFTNKPCLSEISESLVSETGEIEVGGLFF